jgi:hypothetical protein
MTGGAGSARAGALGGGSPWLLATALVLAAGTVGLLAISRASASADPAMLLAVPFVLLVAWMLLTSRHEFALAILLLYLALLDGYLKLSVSAGNELPGLGRDALLYAIAIGMVVRGIVKRQPFEAPPLTAWVVAWVAVVMVQLLNPENGSVLHSVASLRQHIEFVPLFFIAYSIMRTRRRLRAFLMLLLVVAAVNGVVSLVQFNMSPDQLANWGPGYSDLINGDGAAAPRTAVGSEGEQRTRPMALGSDMGFGGALGAIAIPAAFALLVGTGGGWRRLAPVAVAGAGAALAVATSQSRSAVVAAIVGVIAFAALATVSRQALKALAAVIVVGLASMFVLTEIDDGGSFSRYESITPSRVFGTTVKSREGSFQSIDDYLVQFPLGTGIGSVGPAAGVIDPPPFKGLGAENQLSFLIVEVGIPGLLLLIAFHARLVGLVVRRIRRLASSELRLLLAAVSAPLFALLSLWVVGVNTVSTPSAPYLWFMAGTLSYWLCGPGRRAGGDADGSPSA